MEMKPEGIVSLVRIASHFGVSTASAATEEHEAASCRSGNPITGSVITWNRVDVPVVAAGIVSGNGIAGHLSITRFRRRWLCPIGRHIDSVFVAVGVEEVHD